MSNLYDALKPLLVTSKMLGTVSFKFGRKGYKVSKFDVYPKTILALIYLCLSGYAISKRTDFVFYTLTISATDILQLVACALLVVIAWLLSAFYQKKSILILLKILNVDKEMRQLGVWIRYDKLKRLIYLNVIIRLTLFTFGTIFQMLALHYLTSFGSISNGLIFLFLYHLPILINTVILQEVSIYVTILRNRFQILNDHLSALQGVSNESISDTIKMIRLTTFSGTKFRMLRVICPLHHELSKMSEVINERFGIVLLMSFLNAFVATVANLYYCSKAWEDTIRERTRFIIGALLYCVIYIAETAFICYTCNATVEEANKSGTLIHKIDTDDNDVKDQIEMFSLQIAHKRVEFSAAGLFPINYTLLFSIIGGVTTNLVILIQFSAN